MDAVERAVVEQEPERPSAAVAAPPARPPAGRRPRQHRPDGAAQGAGAALRLGRAAVGGPAAPSHGPAGRWRARRPSATGWASSWAATAWGSAPRPCFALVILGLAATMTVQAVRLARQRDEIQRERDKAVQVAEFLEEIFSAADPGQARGETVTAREILDRGAAQDHRRARRPAGDPGGARRRHRPGLRRPRPLRPRPAAPRAVARPAAPGLRRRAPRGGREPPRAGGPRTGRAASWTSPRPPSARRSRCAGRSSAAPIRRSPRASTRWAWCSSPRRSSTPPSRCSARRSPSTASTTATTMSEVGSNLGNLGLLMKQKGDLAAAEALYREALAIFRRLFGAAHPEVAIQLNNLAVLQYERGDFAAAEASYREMLPVARPGLRPGAPPGRLVPPQPRGRALLARQARRGRAPGARVAGDAAQAPGRRARAGRRWASTCSPRSWRRRASSPAAGRSTKSRCASTARPSARSIRGSATALANLADLLAQQGDPAAAEPLARQALAIRRRTLGEAHPDVGSSLTLLGSLRLARGAPEEAEPLLRQGLGVLQAALSDDPLADRRGAEPARGVPGGAGEDGGGRAAPDRRLRDPGEDPGSGPPQDRGRAPAARQAARLIAFAAVSRVRGERRPNHEDQDQRQGRRHHG